MDKTTKPTAGAMGANRSMFLDIGDLGLDQLKKLRRVIGEWDAFATRSTRDWELLLKWEKARYENGEKPEFRSIQIMTVRAVKPEDFETLIELGLVLPAQ